MTDPTPPVQPKTPPGSKTLIYSPQVRIVISSGGREIDVSKDIIRGRVVRVIDAVSVSEFYLNNKNGKYTGVLRRMDKVVIWMKRVTWIQVFTGYLDIVPAYDLFPTEAYIRASCTLKRIKYTYWDKALPASVLLLNPNINLDTDNIGIANDAPDGATGIIIHDMLTKIGGWPANQVLIQQIPTKFMDLVKDNIKLVDQVEVFNRILRYIQGGGVADGLIYPWTSNPGSTPAPQGSNGRYTLEQMISLVKGVLNGQTLTSDDKIAYFVAYAMKFSGGNPNTRVDDTGSGGSGRDMYGLLGLDHRGVSGKTLTIDQLKDPVANIKQAWIASGQGSNFTYWSASLGYGAPPDNFDAIKQQVPTVAAFDTSAVATPSNPATQLSNSPLQDLFSKFYGQSSGTAAGQVVAYAIDQIGIPYGSPNPRDGGGGKGDGSDHTFDCSGLVMKAYERVNLPLPHNAHAQAVKTFHYQVPKSNGHSWQIPSAAGIGDLQGGDLLFMRGSAPDSGDGVPDIGHVAIYVGGNQLIEAGNPVGYGTVLDRLDGSAGPNYTINFVTRPISMLYSLNDNTGTWTNTNENGGTNSAYRLFNFLFGNTFNDPTLSNLLKSDFGPANDESLLGGVSQVCSGSLRSFMSGPNGDFIAFFPDYFGINQTQAVWDIEDVEIVDLKIQINDDELVTHVYTIGDTDGDYAIKSNDWLTSSGEVSIQMKAVMDQLLSMQSSTGFLSDPDAFLQRFGLRPMTSQLSIIRSHYYEFFSSMYTFLQQWAKQFSTDVKIGFMPELYPGMRMNLVNHDVCVYVESVIHTFDYQEGFQTYPTISCPSSPAGGANGLPIAVGL